MNTTTTFSDNLFSKDLNKEMPNEFTSKLSHDKNAIIHAQKIIYGWKVKLIILKLRISVLWIAISNYRNPIIGVKFLLHVINLRRATKGKVIKKMVKANEKYYMGPYVPGWNGKAFKSFILSEMNNFNSLDKPVNRFNNVFLAITKKCILQCEHCFEWDVLNKKDVLTVQKIKEMVVALQKKGVNQIYLTGGEPMLKLNTMIDVIKTYKEATDFWILTSGYNFNLKNAEKLKKAGLNGVIISLDHFNPIEHNKFRGNENAFKWVVEAVNSALENNIIVALSICITRSFATAENLLAYMNLAKSLKVSFVQFLEPKPVGNYFGKDVSLLPAHEAVLESTFLKMNRNKSFKNYPLIIYHGFYQRRLGCFNGGLTGLYIDTDGDINACPFCRIKNGSILNDDFDNSLTNLAKKGCPEYTIAHY